eukprot:248001_1
MGNQKSKEKEEFVCLDFKGLHHVDMIAFLIVNGFIRQFPVSAHFVIPNTINSVILLFYYEPNVNYKGYMTHTIVGKFDTSVYNKHKWKLSKGNTCITGLNPTYNSFGNHSCVYIGNGGFDNGVHYVAIQYIKGESSTKAAIGVTTVHSVDFTDMNNICRWPKYFRDKNTYFNY